MRNEEIAAVPRGRACRASSAYPRGRRRSTAPRATHKDEPRPWRALHGDARLAAASGKPPSVGSTPPPANRATQTARARKRREHAALTTEKDIGIRKPRFGSADYRGPRASEAGRRGPCSSGSTICFQAAQTQDGATARNRRTRTSIEKPGAFRRPRSPSAPK